MNDYNCTNTTLQWRTNIQHIKAEWGDVGDFSDVKIQPHFDPIASNSAEITEVSRYVFSFLFIFIHLFLVIFPNDPRATYY